VQSGRSQVTTLRRMHIACWITNTADTHSECVILNAFPLIQWLHERASVLRYTYIAYLFFFIYAFICQPLGPISHRFNPVHTSHAISVCTYILESRFYLRVFVAFQVHPVQ
jgi:hypothetical protein